MNAHPPTTANHYRHFDPIEISGPFPNRLHEQRRVAKVSRNWLAKLVKIKSPYQLLQLEKGNQVLQRKDADVIASVLGIAVDDLFVSAQVMAAHQYLNGHSGNGHDVPPSEPPPSPPAKLPEPRRTVTPEIDIALILSDGRVLGGCKITLDETIIGELMKAAMKAALK